MSGLAFPGLLTLLFITLKLTALIAWPWVWVLAPLWIVAVLVWAALIIVLVAANG